MTLEQPARKTSHTGLAGSRKCASSLEQPERTAKSKMPNISPCLGVEKEAGNDIKCRNVGFGEQQAKMGVNRHWCNPEAVQSNN